MMKCHVATPRANGQIERYNRTITTTITTDKKMGEIEMAVLRISNTQYQILFGFQPRNALPNLLSLISEDDVALNREDFRMLALQKIGMGEPWKLRPLFKELNETSHVLNHDRYLVTDIQGAERTQRTFRSVYSYDRLKAWYTPHDPSKGIRDDSSVRSTVRNGTR
ncbi:hypothetical protein Trydic_g22495 [Trypoxylus dichotomus]